MFGRGLVRGRLMVTILGAGVAGVSLAWALARRGRQGRGGVRPRGRALGLDLESAWRISHPARQRAEHRRSRWRRAISSSSARSTSTFNPTATSTWPRRPRRRWSFDAGPTSREPAGCRSSILTLGPSCRGSTIDGHPGRQLLRARRAVHPARDPRRLHGGGARAWRGLPSRARGGPRDLAADIVVVACGVCVAGGRRKARGDAGGRGRRARRVHHRPIRLVG